MPTALPEDLAVVSAADGAVEIGDAAAIDEDTAAEGSTDTDTTSQGTEAVETATAEGGSALAAPDEPSAYTDDDDEGEAMVNPEDIASVIGESIVLSNLQPHQFGTDIVEVVDW